MRKIISIILATCFLFSAMPVMAAEADYTTNQEDTIVVTRASTDQFVYNGPGSDMTLNISKQMSYFRYSSGPFGASNVVVRFTNISTGAYCTHSIVGSSANGMNYCNISPGTYRVSLIQNASAAGYFSIVFYN